MEFESHRRLQGYKLLQQLTAPEPGKIKLFWTKKGIIFTFMIGRPDYQNNPVPDAIIRESPLFKWCKGGLYVLGLINKKILSLLPSPVLQSLHKYITERTKKALGLDNEREILQLGNGIEDQENDLNEGG